MFNHQTILYQYFAKCLQVHSFILLFFWCSILKMCYRFTRSPNQGEKVPKIRVPILHE